MLLHQLLLLLINELFHEYLQNIQTREKLMSASMLRKSKNNLI